MNKEEIEQYKNITQEIFKKQYNSIKDLGNCELRKVILIQIYSLLELRKYMKY